MTSCLSDERDGVRTNVWTEKTGDVTGLANALLNLHASLMQWLRVPGKTERTEKRNNGGAL